MTKQTPIDAVNHLMNTLRYSVASYLGFSRPWFDASTQPLTKAIEHVATCHRLHVTRIGQLLIERHGHVEPRTFPLAFTGLNGLSIEYLLPLVIEDENQIIAIIQATAVALECDAEASDLVAGVLDSEKRNLQILESALGQCCSMRGGASVQARQLAPHWPAANANRLLRTPPMGRGAASLSPRETPSRRFLLSPGDGSGDHARIENFNADCRSQSTVSLRVNKAASGAVPEGRKHERFAKTHRRAPGGWPDEAR